MYSHKFKDGATVEVAELVLSSREMRKLRKETELDIMYALLEDRLSEDELDAVETDVNGSDREFSEVTAFFGEWFEAAVSGK